MRRMAQRREVCAEIHRLLVHRAERRPVADVVVERVLDEPPAVGRHVGCEEATEGVEPHRSRVGTPRGVFAQGTVWREFPGLEARHPAVEEIAVSRGDVERFAGGDAQRTK